MDINGVPCTDDQKKRWLASSHFGYFTDTTWQKINNAADSVKYLGHVGDSVVTALGKITLLDSLEGAHGGTYDPYSNTIFIFGGAKIVQIEPKVVGGVMTAEIVGTIDLRQYFFPEDTTHLPPPRTPSCQQHANATTGEWGNSGQSGYCDGGTRYTGPNSWTTRNDATPTVGWRLDQGTVDGFGHLFVASNTGHVIFVDYAANDSLHIGNNILLHMEWIDNFLDDLAPLEKDKVIRSSASSFGGLSSSDYERLSSQVEYHSSSSMSSSSKGSTPGSSGSSSNSNGSSGSGNSSNSNGSSNSGDSSNSGESSGSNGSSSNSGESSDSNGSSSNSGESSGSNGSSSNSGESSDSNGSSSNSGESSDSNGSSSNSEDDGGGILYGSSNSDTDPSGGGAIYGYSAGSGGYYNPSWDDYDKGDSVVQTSGVLTPANDKKPGDAGTVTIFDNVYYVDKYPISIPLDFRQNANLDSAKVGDVVAITLSADKVKEYFGDSVQTLTITTPSGLTLIDPKNPKPGESIEVDANGNVTFYVTAYEPVQNGEIYITDDVGNLVVLDNINFFAVVPDGKVAMIKDSDLDSQLDYVEILLQDTLPKNVSITSVTMVVNGKVMNPATVPTLNRERNRIILNDVTDLTFPDEIDLSSYVSIEYKDETNGAIYVRKVPLIELGTNIIKAAHAIRDTSKGGMDSLFVEFNIDVVPYDLRYPEMLIAMKQKGKEIFFGLGQVSKVYLPSKNIVIFVGEDLKLQGNMKDSVSLYPNVTFNDAPYITSDEYDRHVPVTVVDRLPTVKDVEYWDTDYNGVLDQVVINYSAPLKQEDLEKLRMSFPWYSSRGLLIQLQAQPAYLKIDPKDPTKVIWDVYAATELVSGVTSISEQLPQATVYTYYSVFEEIFVNEEPVKIVDKMSPIIAGATLNYGKKTDTLLVRFSEPIKKVDGRDFFRYIHGKDTSDLVPSSISWSEDGFTAKLILDASQGTILPGDSLMVVRGSKGRTIQDNFGNISGDDPSPVVIGGLLNHLVESTQMGTFDDKDEVLHTLSSVNLRYMPSSTTKEDLEKEGVLGQLVQLGERFVPQLLDRAQIAADGSVDPSVLDSLDPEKVFISFVVNYFDHLGQYVNDTAITVPCNSPKFGGNCLNSDQKVFVNWNFKDHKGRFVGAGVYTVQFKMVVRYEKKKIEEEIKDKWGVRRKKKK